MESARQPHLAGPTVAYQNVKMALRASLGNSLEEQLGLEARLQKKCGQTCDFAEGVLAFTENAPPSLRGAKRVLALSTS